LKNIRTKTIGLRLVDSCDLASRAIWHSDAFLVALPVVCFLIFVSQND